MDKSKLSDGEWGHLIGKLKKMPGIRVGYEASCRRFVGAVLWMLRSGAQWRLLPDKTSVRAHCWPTKGIEPNALLDWLGQRDIKYFRRIAACHEKKASHFMEMLTFAAVLLWLR